MSCFTLGVGLNNRGFSQSSQVPYIECKATSAPNQHHLLHCTSFEEMNEIISGPMAMGMMLDHLVIFLSNYTAESEMLLTVSFSSTFRRPCVAQSWRSSSNKILFHIFIKKFYFTVQVIQKTK